jgi:Tfp pilus assembly protein PilF
VTWLRRAVAAMPSEYQSHYALHQALEQAGRTDEAREELERLKVVQADTARLRKILNYELGLRPHDPALLCEIGTILLRDGLTKRGLEWLHGALKADPKYAPAHAALANYYEMVGERGRASYHRGQAEQSAAAPQPPSG